MPPGNLMQAMVSIMDKNV